MGIKSSTKLMIVLLMVSFVVGFMAEGASGAEKLLFDRAKPTILPPGCPPRS